VQSRYPAGSAAVGQGKPNIPLERRRPEQVFTSSAQGSHDMTRIDPVLATLTELPNAFGGGRGEDSQHERPPAVVAAFLGPVTRDVIGHYRTLEPQAQPTRRLSSRGTTTRAVSLVRLEPFLMQSRRRDDNCRL
jgi:hypothetical protein